MKLAKITLLFIALIISEISLSQINYEKDVFRKESGKFADLDNDGVIDMVTCFSEINVHRGKPNLEYYLPKYIDTCVSVVNNTYVYFDFYLEDYNNDGLKDILCLSNHDNNITYYENKGNLSFQKHELYSEVGEYRNFMVYDVNVDGKMDLLFVKDNQLLYKTQQNGSLGASVIALTYVHTSYILSHKDLNSDGRQDLVEHSPSFGRSYLNFTSNFFTSESYISASSSYMSNDMYDFNQDGVSDLLICKSTGLVYYHNNIIQQVPFNVSFDNAYLQILQLDSDPEPEILVYKGSSYIYKIDYNYSTDSFDVPVLIANSALNTIGDINNDGFMDFVTASFLHENSFLINDGFGNFQSNVINIFTTAFAQAGDIDNDGLVDEVLTSKKGIYWQKRIDLNEYEMPRLIMNYAELTNFRLGDLDNDGDLDIVFALGYYLQGSTYDGIGYKLNDGTGNFGNTIMLDENANNAQILLADMDGNGFLDVVGIYNAGGNDRLYCYFNSNTSFTNTLIEIFSGLEVLLLQDYNDNSTMDIICKRSGNLVNYEFNGNTFQSPVNLFTINTNGIVRSFSDIDNDGDLDYLYTKNGTNDNVFLLKKEATGIVETILPLDNNLPFLPSLQFYDYDNDGDDDLLLAQTQYYDIYINDGIGNFTFLSSMRTREKQTSFFPDYDGLILKGLYTRSNRRMRKLVAFNLGTQPTLSLPDTVYSCSNDIVTLNVTNNTNLNNSSEWILISDSLNGPIVDVSPSGQFNIQTDTTKYYYVRAAGNSTYQGIPDSILFIVYPISNGPTTTISTCTNYLWNQNGVNYSASGNYYDTLTAANGCDSLVKLELTIIPIIGTIDSVTNCQNYVWAQNGVNYNNSGVYYDTILSAGGCDSIVSLQLTILQSSIDIQNVTSCNTYFWTLTGLTYNLSGNYNDTLIASNGCDSIVTLQLNILPTTNSIENVMSCENYVWPQNSLTYTNSGIYYDTVLSVNGCDSILFLDLTIFNPSFTIQTITSCNTYLWPVTGLNYNLSGTYTDTLVGQGGCDSIIQLQLNIENYNAQINTFSTPSSTQNCDGGLTVETFSNSTFYHVLNNTTNASSNGSVLISNLCPGIYNLATIFGCGDTINQTVVIPVDTNYVFHNWYSDSTVLDSLAQTIPNCNINLNDITSAAIDSVWYLGNIINVVWNISTSTDTILVTTSYTLNNGYGVYLIQLSVYCPITPIGQYLTLNQEFDEYFTVSESIHFGDPILNVYQIDPDDYDVNVYPNPTYDEVTVTFNADQLSLKIINLQGQIVHESKIKSGETVSLVKFDAGMYLFKLVSEQGVSLKRVIKN